MTSGRFALQATCQALTQTLLQGIKQIRLFHRAQHYPTRTSPQPKQAPNELQITLNEALFYPFRVVGAVGVGVVLGSMTLVKPGM